MPSPLCCSTTNRGARHDRSQFGTYRIRGTKRRVEALGGIRGRVSPDNQVGPLSQGTKSASAWRSPWTASPSPISSSGNATVHDVNHRLQHPLAQLLLRCAELLGYKTGKHRPPGGGPQPDSHGRSSQSHIAGSTPLAAEMIPTKNCLQAAK